MPDRSSGIEGAFLKVAPAIDIYAWLTFRMSYLRKRDDNSLGSTGDAVWIRLRAHQGIQGGIPRTAETGSSCTQYGKMRTSTRVGFVLAPEAPRKSSRRSGAQGEHLVDPNPC